MKIFLAIPVYQGMCHIKFMESITALIILLKSLNIDFFYFSLTSESLVSRARNVCACEFIKSNCTHLMFIDADIVFNPQDVINFLHYEKDIICGVYPHKTLSFTKIEKEISNSNNLKQLIENSASYSIDKHLFTNQIVKSPYGQTGFMMISKNVFEKIVANYKSDLEYVNDVPLYNQYSLNNNIFYDFFQVGIVNKRYLSEDYGFCDLAAKCDIDIYLDTSIKLTHIGQFFFHG